MKLVTVTEAALELGISARRVRAIIQAGRLPAQMMGRTWVIKEKDLEKVRDRKPGRPRKTQK